MPRDGKEVLERARRRGYPWSDGSTRREDPTYGKIDRDIQWHVWDMLSKDGRVNKGQLWAIQSTLQERRADGELLGLPTEKPRRVFVLFAGFGPHPPEAAEYIQQVRIRIGFGPGLWVLAGKRRVFMRRPWRRVL